MALAEPTHKMIFLENTMRDGKVFRLYSSGGLMPDTSASPDRVVIAGREVSPEEIERGWVDLDSWR